MVSARSQPLFTPQNRQKSNDPYITEDEGMVSTIPEISDIQVSRNQQSPRGRDVVKALCYASPLKCDPSTYEESPERGHDREPCERRR